MDARRDAILRTLGIERYVLRASPSAAAVSAESFGLAEPSAAEAADPAFAPTVPFVESPLGAPVAVEELGWDALARTVAGCTRCGLAARRTQTVFGVGDVGADWLVVGEAPGAEEDRRGEPFVGRAGQLLDSMLRALGLGRGRGVFIANVLKCRPPDNRDPRPDEVEQCLPYLHRQIALLRPKLIVCVGRISAQNLLRTDVAIGRLRGRPHVLEPFGIPVVVTYHPAYLLRAPAEKRRAWADLLLAREMALGHRA